MKFYNKIAYLDYCGLIDEKEGERIAEHFSKEEKNQVLFMKNHGVMVVGDSIG